MTKAKIEEMGQMINNMHGLNDRREQHFFFNGMIYYYDMVSDFIYENGYLKEVFYVHFKDTESTVCEIRFEDNGRISGIGRYKDLRKVPYLSNLKAPIKRSF